MNRKAIYFTSDWHVGHANSIKFDDRPFRDIDHMHEVLINNYNAIVPHNGICYFLGDVGITDSKTLNSVYRHLNGTKVCVVGNHDPGVNALYNAGFDIVLHGAEMIIASELVTLRHCPLKGVFREDVSNMHGVQGGENWHGEFRKKHKLLTCEDYGQFHLHGHIHSRKDKKSSKKIEGRQYDVGVTANDYRPISISKIESFIAKTKQNGG